MPAAGLPRRVPGSIVMHARTIGLVAAAGIALTPALTTAGAPPAAVAAPGAAAGDVAGGAVVRPAHVFADHMVLQRERPVPVWGTAPAAAEVVVEFADRSTAARAGADGRWCVTLAPLAASAAGRDLVVRAGADRVVLRDVVVGEVWLAGGQSNMAYTAGQMAARLPEGKELVAAADLPGVRLCRIADADAPEPRPDLAARATWDVATPAAVAGHSAVALVFARRLHRELGVPVGVVDCSRGGTPIEPFIPAGAFVGHPTLERLAALAGAGDVAAIRALPGGTLVRGPSWLAGAIFNGRIAPLAPFAIRGAIWYQGESNCGQGEDPRDYAHKMRALVAGWRAAFAQDDLPVYFVQLPRWRSYAWPHLREEQRRAADVPGTGMVVTIDLDDAGDIHPPNKIDVGERLARWPLRRLHGRDVAVEGPVFRGLVVRGGAVTVAFDHAAGGLVAAALPATPGMFADSGATLIHGCELAGDDGRWHDALARIEGESLVVACAAVPLPRAVRYACRPEPPPDRPWNLCNTSGLPAGPFCSDWSLTPYESDRNPPAP